MFLLLSASLLFLLSTSFVASFQFTEESALSIPSWDSKKREEAVTAFYKGCNEDESRNGRDGLKTCYGAFEEDCVAKKSCHFAVSITDELRGFTITLLDFMDLLSRAGGWIHLKDFFFALGLDTSNDRGGVECRLPTLKDFKVFMFSDRDPRKWIIPKTELSVGKRLMNKNEWKRDCDSRRLSGLLRTSDPNNFNLTSYIRTNSLFSLSSNPTLYRTQDYSSVRFITSDSILYTDIDSLNRDGGGGIESPENSIDRFYEGCATPDRSDKRCFGLFYSDCLQRKSCALAASIKENSTHFQLDLLNSVKGQFGKPSGHVYMAASLATVVKTVSGDELEIECRTPTMEDFKIFLFWNHNGIEKASNGTDFSKASNTIDKETFRRNCERDYAGKSKKFFGDEINFYLDRSLSSIGIMTIRIHDEIRNLHTRDRLFYTNYGEAGSREVLRTPMSEIGSSIPRQPQPTQRYTPRPSRVTDLEEGKFHGSNNRADIISFNRASEVERERQERERARENELERLRLEREKFERENDRGRLDRIRAETERIRQQESRQETDRIRQLETDRIRQQETDRIRQQESERIRQQETERTRGGSREERIRNVERERISQEESLSRSEQERRILERERQRQRDAMERLERERMRIAQQERIPMESESYFGSRTRPTTSTLRPVRPFTYPQDIITRPTTTVPTTIRHRVTLKPIINKDPEVITPATDTESYFNRVRENSETVNLNQRKGTLSSRQPYLDAGDPIKGQANEVTEVEAEDVEGMNRRILSEIARRKSPPKKTFFSAENLDLSLFNSPKGRETTSVAQGGMGVFIGASSRDTFSTSKTGRKENEIVMVEETKIPKKISSESDEDDDDDEDEDEDKYSRTNLKAKENKERNQIQTFSSLRNRETSTKPTSSAFSLKINLFILIASITYTILLYN